MKNESLSLIGMAGVGKSTIGKALADRLNKPLIDTDLVIVDEHQQSLQTLLDDNGYLGLRAIEAQTIVRLTATNAIISTGGSAVYSFEAMQHLKSFGPIVFLDASLATIMGRINNFSTRGLACKPGQSFEDLFNERQPLYRAAADICVDCNVKSAAALAKEIIARCELS